eukprot:Tamp_08281.p1 GENE.Tamp_08281~~Tamp_08281.p1  ORF type:complete len:468 (+),score=87.22 Tamp_08281:21-1424(+)
MDEIDGMSSGDAGGIAKVVELSATAKLPIIAICNEEHSPKVRTLASKCLKIRFYRPRPWQILPRLKHICRMEGFTQIEDAALTKIATIGNGDIRSMINNLELLRVGNTKLTLSELHRQFSDPTLGKDGGMGAKSFEKMGMFENFVSFFDETDKAPSVQQKINDFFQEPMMTPTMVLQNMWKFKPSASRNVSDAALTEARIQAVRSMYMGTCMQDLVMKDPGEYGDMWPMIAISSAIYPAHLCRGKLQGRLEFPTSLGTMSKAQGNRRKLIDLTHRISRGVGLPISPKEVRNRYIPELNNWMLRPLALAATNKTLIDIVVPFVVDTLETYCLEPENLAFMSSVESVNAATDVWNEVSSQAKGALTKAYNLRFPKAGSDVVCVRRDVATNSKKKTKVSVKSGTGGGKGGASGGEGGGDGDGGDDELLSHGASSRGPHGESGLGNVREREAEKEAEKEEELEAFKQSWGV